MKAQPPFLMLPEPTSVSAWQELLAQAAPDLSQRLVGQQPQVWPRFADYYRTLQSLPRRVRRHLQRQCRRARPHLRHGTRRRAVQSLAGVALMLALGQAPALAANINVGGGCTLVDAITAANTDNAIGLCPPGSGADTLVLRTGSTHTLTQVNNSTPYGPTG